MDLKLALQRVHYFLFVCSCAVQVYGQGNTFNVLDYGAYANGNSDNSRAFLEAWDAACQSNAKSQVLVPSGSYLVNPVRFEGPCNSPIVFQIDGTLIAPSGPRIGADIWITFFKINALTVTGKGAINGQGPSAWSYSGRRPHSMRFSQLENSRIEGITSIDSKFFHFIMFKCKGVTFSNLKISAPDDSPNTDGIHISNSENINIYDSDIATGDDCISLGDGSKNIKISGIKCGPGHGISIGSLGKYEEEDNVHGIYVTDSMCTGTDNGLRIKTFASSLPSKASNITFQNIFLKNVKNPIIIDQFYCPSKSCNSEGSSKVEISDVKFINIRGSSSSLVAVDLQCSKSAPCRGIEMRDISLPNYNDPQVPTKSFCSNVHGIASGELNPAPCV